MKAINKIKESATKATTYVKEFDMSWIKKSFIETMAYVKFIVAIAVIGVSFYSGMYIVAAQQNPEDAKGVMITTLEKVFKDTSDQPIIMIVPEISMYEKAKLMTGMELPEREVVTITSTQTQRMLGIHIPEEPTMVKTAFIFWDDKAGKAIDGTVSGWKWFSDKVTFTN